MRRDLSYLLRPANALVSVAEVLGRYSRKTAVNERFAKIKLELSRGGERGRAAGGWQPHALERRLGVDRVNRVVADYLSGHGCTTLARRYGLSENGVSALLKRSGVELRPAGRVTPDGVAEMRRLRELGWTYQAIGEKFGITRVAVSARLRGGRHMEKVAPGRFPVRKSGPQQPVT